jgi:hypothetical protein
MTHRGQRQLPKFGDNQRRMTAIRQDPIIAVEDTSTQAWLLAADVIVGTHRTKHQARQWISSIQEKYPDCLVAVAQQQRGRWCVVGLPARNITMRGGHFDTVAAEQVGRVIYHLWAAR